MNKKMLIVVGVIVLVIIAIVFFITSNTLTSNVKFDLNLVQENVTGLKSNVYDYRKATTALSEKAEELGVMGSFPELVYDFDLENYGIDSSKLLSEDGMVQFTMFKTENESFMMFKPAEGQKEALEKEVDEFYKGKEVKKEEVNGYTVYLNTKKNDEALKIIKEEGY